VPAVRLFWPCCQQHAVKYWRLKHSDTGTYSQPWSTAGLCKLTKQGKLLDQELRMMPPPGLKIYRRPRVTLIFDFLTRNVDRFMPLPNEPLVLICNKTGSFVFKNVICTSLVTDERPRRGIKRAGLSDSVLLVYRTIYCADTCVWHNATGNNNRKLKTDRSHLIPPAAYNYRLARIMD